MPIFEKEEANPLLSDYILLNKFGLSVLGAWPISEDAPEWRRKFQRVHIAVIYFLLLALLVPQLLDIYLYRGNVQAISENLCTSLTTFTVLAKLSNLIINRRTFKIAIREMEKNWSRIMRSGTPKIQREILLCAAERSRTFTLRYCVIMYVTASMYFVLPLITIADSSTQRDREYPFCASYFGLDRSSDLLYAAFYISQVIIGLSCGTGNFSMDSLFFVMVHHTCAQLRILQEELRRLGTSGDSESDLADYHPVSSIREKAITDAEVLQKMKDIVKDHERHIKNARNLRLVFDGASLQQLLVSSVIICVIGFKLIASLDASRFETVIYVTYLHLVIFQIYLYCSPGDDLLNESIRVGQAAYECPWMDFPSSVKRCLLVTTLRSWRPLSITAGNFYVMSMPNFSKILKTSLSYMSVLRAMYDDSDYRKS